ncbi:lanthionine synthetase C family protein [Streptomyces sp. NBC_01465]|uniref:lanthionine synthetase C family protein n=1 Tax=Streptomyces sp. NBC_01465 TaxID=2903878 RepID=UPI002E37D04C|nr:lanthionine synthetase C family protein [Streptomyces sp. NBC_01465]
MITQRPSHQVDFAPQWAQSLDVGAAGIALWHLENVRTGAGDWETAHEWAAAMVRHPVIAHPDICSLYGGAPAVAFVMNAADQPLYTPALEALDPHITALIRRRLAAAHQRIDDQQLPALREYDLIGGLTGLGAYALLRHGDSDIVHSVLSYLVRLTHPLATTTGTLPGWWCGNAPDTSTPEAWDGGHGDLGISHGITGPLALLATAHRRGITVPGLPEAMIRICHWLDQWQTGQGAAAWWPGAISRREAADWTLHQPGPSRPSWCYGTPGIARAQQLAALALGDRRRQQLAETALAGCLADERQLAQIRDLSLCHGWAGLIQSVWRCAADAGRDSPLATRLPYLHSLMDQHQALHGLPADAGLLNGTAGVHLARHTTTTNFAPLTRWDACLLLAG